MSVLLQHSQDGIGGWQESCWAVTGAVGMGQTAPALQRWGHLVFSVFCLPAWPRG